MRGSPLSATGSIITLQPISLFRRGISGSNAFLCFLFQYLKPPWHSFLSLVAFLPLQHNPPLPTIHSSPPLPFTPCRIVSLTELVLTVPDSLGKAQYSWRLLNTQTRTLLHTHSLKNPVCYIQVYQWQEQNVYLNILHLRYIHDM